MSETLLIPSSGAFSQTAPRCDVSVKSAWDEEWVSWPHLYCDTVRWGSGPVRSEAAFTWRYGIGQPAGTTVQAVYSRYNFNGAYVRVTIPQGVGESILYWYGILTDDGDRREGAFIVAGARIKSGQQKLVAEGLDLWLQRTFAVKSIVRIAGENKRINRAITFNDPNDFGGTGNRFLADDGPEGAHVFATDLYTATWWSTRDILQYLMSYLAPSFNWKLSDNAKKILPTWDRPRVKAQGRDLRSIINELCDRRKLLSWRVIPSHEKANPDVLLDVFPLNPTALTLPSGSVIQPNQNLKQIDFDRAADAQVVLRRNDHERVDQVVVRGSRRRAIVSLGYPDGTLKMDWTGLAQTQYETLPAEIAALEDPDRKQSRMQQYRAEDDRERVFAYFALPSDWEGKVGDGKGGSKTPFAKDNNDDPETFYLPGIRFQRFLPKGVIDPKLEETPSDSPMLVMPPICLIKCNDDPDDAVDRYRHVEELAADAGSERVGDGGRKWSGSLKIQPNAPGVIVKLHGLQGGQGQHMIAGVDFDPIQAINDQPAELTWQTMIVTVMFEMDHYAQVVYPLTSGDLPDPSMESPRVLYVDLGDHARMDWVHPGAVRKVIDGKPRYGKDDNEYAGTTGEWIRDDREMMRDLAVLTYQWYGAPHQQFTLLLKQLSGILEVGDLITQIGAAETAEAVDACVTGVSMDLVACTTRVETSFGELDPIQYI